MHTRQQLPLLSTRPTVIFPVAEHHQSTVAGRCICVSTTCCLKAELLEVEHVTLESRVECHNHWFNFQHITVHVCYVVLCISSAVFQHNKWRWILYQITLWMVNTQKVNTDQQLQPATDRLNSLSTTSRWPRIIFPIYTQPRTSEFWPLYF